MLTMESFSKVVFIILLVNLVSILLNVYLVNTTV